MSYVAKKNRFRPNPNVGDEIAQQAAHQAMLREKAEAVKKAAELNSPIGESSSHGYQDRFRIVVYRHRARVLNFDIAAHLVEWGSANNPPYAPLRRGVRAVGLRLDEASKGELASDHELARDAGLRLSDIEA